MISLFPYQQPSAENLLRSLREHRIAVDASDTGTGKTYVAAWIAAYLWEHARIGGFVGVVCPKAVIPVWNHVLEEADVTPIFVLNYEKLRTGSTQWGGFEGRKWEWCISPETLVIFDEVHRCKSPTSQNGRILAASKPYNVLALSATLAQDPTDMRSIGFLLGLHNYVGFYRWCLRNGCWRGPFGGLEFKKKTAHKYLTSIHEQIFPSKGSRIRIADLGDAFPENAVYAETYNFGNEDAVNAAYDAVSVEQNRRILAGEPENVGALQMQARAKAEAIKADGLAAMAKDLIEEGNSVVIFTSFRETLEKLRAKLKCGGVYGGQHDSERNVMIDQFQRDVTRVIVVNIQAGGVGISLHDLIGDHPRVSLICPTFHAVDLKQALGRIHRAGAKSKAVQKIVFAAGTIEERICKRVQAKLDNIALLNDGDLEPVVLTDKEYNDRLNENITVEDIVNKPSPYIELIEAYERSLSSEITPNEQFSLQVADTSLSCPTVEPVKPDETPNLSNSVSESVSTRRPTSPPIDAFLQVMHKSAVRMATGIRSPDGADVGTTTRRHAPLSPSKLKAKAICPGFINDPSGDSKWADRGTLGHKAVEIEDPSICGDDAGLVAAVKKCIAYKRGILRSYRVAPSVFQEIRLDYFDQFGYCDLLTLDGLSADVVDYKFAVNWYAADSPQFWAYAIGVWDKWPVDTVRVHVPHPFRDEIDVETWTRTNDYDRLSAQVAAIIAKAKRNNPSDYRVSAQCAYCGFANKCSKLARLGCDVARHYAPEMTLPDLSLHGSEIRDPSVFASLLPLAPLIEKATGGWKYAARELVEGGTQIPGYELAEKKGRRTIVSAKAAFEAIRAEVSPDMTADSYLDYCDIKASAVDELVRAASPRGQKAKMVEKVQNLLIEGDVFNQGGDVKYLKAIRK